MNIDIVLEGKLKEPFFKAGADEFKKRLKGYLELKIIEVSSIDEYLKNNLKSSDYLITMEIEGNILSSLEFADKIKEIEKDGFYNRILFLICCSDGLSDFAKKKITFKFSMSKFPIISEE